MSQPYVGEIKMVGFNRVPNGWFACNGQLVPISEYEVLFTLLGTVYGGDGQSTFGLPNLSGRLPAHVGPTAPLGTAAGNESITLTTAQLPAHTHAARASGSYGSTGSPVGNVWARSGYVQYSTDPGGAVMQADALQPVGQSEPVDNLSPFQVVTFIIAWAGVFPSQA
jgi:microcystin-dependent protein